MVLSRRHRLAIEFALLALVAYLAAIGVRTAIRTGLDTLPAPPPAATPPPAPAIDTTLASYAVIAERDVFNPAGATAGAAAPATLRLWGVAFQGSEARAVIEDATTGRQALYRVGDRVGGTRIAAIDWDRVTLERGALELVTPEAARVGRAAERAAVAPDPPARVRRDDRVRRVGENAFVVDRRELAGAVDGMSGLLTQLRAVAEVRDGRPAGFRLFHIRDGSLFARLGLRDGDVVQRVNGSTIAEPAALLDFLQRLHTEPRVALDIVRADTPRTLVYDLR
jgi:general secretion pathway protein C